MATAAFVKPEVVRYRTGAANQEEYPEAAAQTYQLGAFVFINGTGQIAQCDGATPANIVTNGVLGIAPLPAKAETDALRRIEPLDPPRQIKMNVYHSGDEDLAVTSQAIVGDDFAIIINTVNGIDFWVIDLNNTTDKVVRILKLAPTNPVGDQFGTVYASVLKSLTQYNP